MGISSPKFPHSDGDDPARSPDTESRSLLAANDAGATRRLKVDSLGNLRVTSLANNSAVLNNGNLTNLTSATLSTIVTYTATANGQISHISCSGTVYAKYYLVLNTATIEIKRSGPSRNITFNSFNLSIGDIVDIKVQHFYTGQQEDFEATIYGS